ncbi:hypothetical protein [Gordonia phthalatica]|uniref:AbiEi antitoxin C-terminal domain-containing protein n=1 Tax=Gordonia phthalatica TaxID=1136941 RepID=A0A0N9N1J6_9ACTN|nr:hypothetical protein [Gordonia phthalatica]ALG84481.1 hypothetical protein ACH46_08200 [Gordonia phthalatica]
MFPEDEYGIIRRTASLDVGYTDLQLRAAVREGVITPLGDGAFIRTELLPKYDVDDEIYRYASIAAGVGQTLPLSHESAAAVHRLELLKPARSLIHFAKPGATGGRLTKCRHVHVGLPDDEVVIVDGLPVASIARTAVDIAAASDFAGALTALDSALRLGVTHDELAELAERHRLRGIAMVRYALRYANGLAANPGESWSRAQMIEARLPAAILQRHYVLLDGSNAYPDFDWDGRLVGEFDGLRKYCRDIRPGESVEDVVVREKLREDALREIVDDVVRWIWRDLEDRTMVPKVMRKLARLGLV